MIKMQEVIDLLTDCELGNLVYVDADTKKINQDTLPKLIRSINNGVLDLHKRFMLKEGSITIDLDPAIHRYYLRAMYQLDNGKPKAGLVQYIRAGDDKLSPQAILKVERVLDHNGVELEINEIGSHYGVMTPAVDILQVPDKVLVECKVPYLELKFRMAPKKPVVCLDDMEEWCCLDVDIPYTHLQALIWYVASRSHTSIGFAENTTNESNNYSNKYEMECANLDSQNYRVDQQGQNDRLVRGGWV